MIIHAIKFADEMLLWHDNSCHNGVSLKPKEPVTEK